ncbi:MAG: DUF427 domain-containing protein [Rhodospirillaceae bacterium]
MAKAVWNNLTIVESADIVHVEGNAYFNIDDVKPGVLENSQTTPPTYCHWKGIAEYFDLVVNGKRNPGGAWYYPDPYPPAEIIRGRLAFWNGVETLGVPEGRGLVEGEPDLGEKQGWEALCWLIKFSEKDSIPMDEITAVTGITADEIPKLWNVFDVQRYSKKYSRELSGNTKIGWSISRV